ncbi:snoRNA-binding rRNA-processing protein [Phytophthora oleae]|uniref:SnoRNA-binding rRNA-processing protein n=1 Tax=Phytophthora oleae TaxID=2107226 RepID=A0ABD3F3T1_9STRA
MKAVACAVAEDGSPFVVDIEDWKKVSHLKTMIKEENCYTFAAKHLTLFLTKKGSNWIKSSDPDMKGLERGRIPAGIESMLNDANKMNALSILSELGFPDTYDGEIHILVDLQPSVKNFLYCDLRQEKPEEWLSGTGLRSASLWHWLHNLFSAEKASHAKKVD